MSTYELLAELPVVIEGYELEGHEAALSSEFVRKTTVIRLRGSGEEGLGEDVTYAAEDQEALQRAGASAPPGGLLDACFVCRAPALAGPLPTAHRPPGVSPLSQLGV